WGSFWYEQKNDQLRAKIQLRDIPHEELLRYDFINLTKNSGELVLNWEKKQFPVKVEFAVDEIVIANAEEELKNTVGFSWQGFASAANYASKNQVHLDKASVWIDKAIAKNKSFNTLNTKAAILKQTGKTADADAVMKEAVTLATEFELNNYGYQLINDGS